MKRKLKVKKAATSVYRWGRICFWSGLLIFGAACTRHIYVPVEKVRSDTLCLVRERLDTVIDRDTVEVCISGDTVLRTVTRWRWRSRLHRDTVTHIVHDTIREPLSPKIAQGKEKVTPKENTFDGKLKSAAGTIKWACRIGFGLLVLFLSWPRLRKVLKYLLAIFKKY